MNKYFNYLVFKSFLYFFYTEIKNLLRICKYLFNFFKHINFFNYFIFKKKNFHILKDGIQKEALSDNYNFWNKFLKSDGNKNGEVLITSLVSLKYYTIYNCIIGLILSKTYKKKPTALINKYDFNNEIFMRSFGIDKFYYIPEGNFFKRVKYFFLALKIIGNIRTIDEFLMIKNKNIDLGKIVYNHFIRFNGIASLNFITPKFYYFLSKVLLINNFSKDLFKSNNINDVVQSESQFIPSSLVFQNALENNCKVFSRLGLSDKISVRIYNNIRDAYTNRYRFSKKLFDHVFINHKDKVIKETKNFIEKRLLGTFGYHTDHDVGENMKHIIKNDQNNLINIYSKNELCKKFNWDTNKPIVVIFSVDLTDGIYTDNWRLFKDNLTWIKETLNIVKNINHINWLIKPHPNDIKNKVITSSSKEVLKLSKDFRNINLFPDNYGNRSLPEIMSSVVTLNGSIGYEYPSLGIPSIICGESIYSGKGFNYEPKTTAEYTDLLKKADRLPPLSSEEINKAKTFIYIYSILAKVHTPLVPNDKIGGIDEAQFWNNFKILLNNYKIEEDNFYKNFKIQLENFDWHTINNDFLK
mgnify:CR=1 FL=1|jgi:hypothetical protein